MTRISVVPALIVLVASPSHIAAADGFDGVWDAYGGVSCREGVAYPEKFVIRQGKLVGTLNTTDNAGEIVGTVDAFGMVVGYASGHFTLIRLKGAMNETEAYGEMSAEGDDVDCTGAWSARKRVDADRRDVHAVQQPDGSVKSIPLPGGYRSRSQTWNGQLEFERKYKELSKAAEEKRIRTIMKK